MNRFIFAIVVAFFLLNCSAVYAQTDKDLALQKAKQAIKLEDDGKFDEALALLKESQKLDPENITYPYEITYVYYSQKQYAKVIDDLSKLKDHKDSFDRLYQLLGNSYDNSGQSDQAIATYEEGLKKFPKAGMLYLERGIIPLYKKEYDKALYFFEKGIEADPKFSSNYFWCAKIYCGSAEKMWGMIYGELFMNLERNSQRTAEISKLLFDTYKSQIVFKSATESSVSFSKQNTIAINPSSKEFKLPFSVVYEPLVLMATIGETSIDLNSLDRIRTKFNNFYFQKEFGKKYPNILFDYQAQIIKAGHIEAYNHWLLLKGDEQAFNTWKDGNPDKWKGFIQWFSANQLQLDDAHKFYRAQY